MLNLYQLHMFVTVADKGSFSAAAKELLVTQPAVSEQIRSLEQRLGVRLFDRRGHRLEITPEGAGMLEPARRLLLLAQETEQDLMDRRGVISGRLRLGCATSAAAPTLARLAGEFLRLHPQVSLKIEPQEQQAMLDQLREGHIDAGFSGEQVRGRGLEHHEVATDEWVLLVPEAHDWYRMADAGSSGAEMTIDPTRLRDQPLVLEGSESSLGAHARRELQVLLDERGITWRDLHLALELPDAPAVERAVAAGAGVGILPRAARAAHDGARLLTLQGTPLTRYLYMLRTHRTPSTVANAWWDFVATHQRSDE